MTVWSDLIAAYRDYTQRTPALRVASFAQWILESGRGQSELARNYLNFGGIKFRPRMVGFATPVEYTGTDGETTEYCNFSSVNAFIAGYWHFITGTGAPYGDWQNYANDAEGYIRYLKAVGYSTKKTYVAEVTALFPEARSLMGLGAK